MYIILERDNEKEYIRLDKICKITKVDKSDEGIIFIKVSLLNGEIYTILEYENSNKDLVEYMLSEFNNKLFDCLYHYLPLNVNNEIKYIEEKFKSIK